MTSPLNLPPEKKGGDWKACHLNSEPVCPSTLHRLCRDCSCVVDSLCGISNPWIVRAITVRYYKEAMPRKKRTCYSIILSSRVRVRAKSSLYVFHILCTAFNRRRHEKQKRRTHHMSSSMYCSCTCRISSRLGLSHWTTCIGWPTSRGVQSVSKSLSGIFAKLLTNCYDPFTIRHQTQVIWSNDRR